MMSDLTSLYEQYVQPHFSKFLPVEIDQAYFQKIDAFVRELVKKKYAEAHHQCDHHQEVKRFTTGFLGEAAMEKICGFPIIDWTIDDSKLYHHPDIPGYTIGIKTVELGKFPIVFKKNYYPQIICIRQESCIHVCGIATQLVLNRYQSDDLILDPALRARGTKTGFYGFEHLLPLKSLQDLAPYRKA